MSIKAEEIYNIALDNCFSKEARILLIAAIIRAEREEARQETQNHEHRTTTGTIPYDCSFDTDIT